MAYNFKVFVLLKQFTNNSVCYLKLNYAKLTDCISTNFMSSYLFAQAAVEKYKIAIYSSYVNDKR